MRLTTHDEPSDEPRIVDDSLQEWVDELRDSMTDGETRTFTSEDVLRQSGGLEPVSATVARKKNILTERPLGAGRDRRGAIQRISTKLNRCVQEGLLVRNPDGSYSFAETGLDTDLLQIGQGEMQRRLGAFVEGVDFDDDEDFM